MREIAKKEQLAEGALGSSSCPLLVVPLDDESEPSSTTDNPPSPSSSPKDDAGPIGVVALENTLPDKDETITPWANFLLASIAGCLASIFTHPFDVLRTQMQLWSYQPDAKNASDSLQTLAASLKPQEREQLETLLKEANAISPPEAGSASKYLANNSKLQPAIGQTQPSKLQHYVAHEKPAAVISRPIPSGAHIVRPEQQVGVYRPGVFRFTYNLVSNEGFSVFWRGLLPRLARRTIATALAWTTFEEFNYRFLRAFTMDSTEKAHKYCESTSSSDNC